MIPFSNPEFIRLVRSKLRATNIALITGAAVFIVGGIAGFFIFLRSVGAFARPVVNWNECFAVQTTIVGYGFAYYGLVLASQGVALERERFTFDFQRMVAMGPWKLAVGKLFGSSCEALLGFFVASLCTLPTAFLSGILIFDWLLIQVVLFSSLLLFIAVGLMSSCIAARANHAAGIGFLLGGLLSTIFLNASSPRGGFFSAANPALLVQSYITEGRGGAIASPCHLFGLTIPMLAAFLSIQSALILVMLFVVSRKLSDPEIPLLSVRQAIYVFGVVQFFMLGTLTDELIAGRSGNFSSLLTHYHVANMVLLTFLSLMLMPSSELLLARLSRARPGEHWRIFFERARPHEDAPPLVTLALFCAAYLVFAAILTAMGRSISIANVGHYAALLLPPVVALASASFVLTVHLYTEKNGLRTAAMVLFGAHIAPIPILLWLAPEKLITLSPSYWIHWATGSQVDIGDVSPHMCPILCVSLTILFSLLAAMRMRFLLDLYAHESRKVAASPN